MKDSGISNLTYSKEFIFLYIQLPATMADAKAFKEAFKILNEFGAEKPGNYNVYELTVTRTNDKTVTKFFTPRQKDIIEDAKMWINGIDLRKYVAAPPAGAAAPPAGAAAPPAAGAPVVRPHPAPYKPYHALQEAEQLKGMTKTAGPQGPGFSIGSGRKYKTLGQRGTGHTHINRARPFFMKGHGKN